MQLTLRVVHRRVAEISVDSLLLTIRQVERLGYGPIGATGYVIGEDERVPTHDDYGDLARRSSTLDLLKHFDARPTGKGEVEEDQVGMLAPGKCQSVAQRRLPV
jgi:hypothetical protein